MSKKEKIWKVIDSEFMILDPQIFGEKLRVRVLNGDIAICDRDGSVLFNLKKEEITELNDNVCAKSSSETAVFQLYSVKKYSALCVWHAKKNLWSYIVL